MLDGDLELRLPRLGYGGAGLEPVGGLRSDQRDRAAGRSDALPSDPIVDED